MRDLLSGLLDLLLPRCCALCGAPSEAALCPRCDRGLPRPPGGAAAPGAGPLDASFAAASYEGDALRLLQRFKYPRPGLSGLDPGATAAARALIREAAAAAPAPHLVVPVPLHPRRLRARGFNPAAVLARAAARARGARCDPVALVRVRDTPSQTGLSRSARRANVRGAFRARPRARIPARVWLVDDVVTTGSTLREAARALRRAGAREVVAVCAARTPLGAADAPGDAPLRRVPARP